MDEARIKVLKKQDLEGVFFLLDGQPSGCKYAHGALGFTSSEKTTVSKVMESNDEW